MTGFLRCELDFITINSTRGPLLFSLPEWNYRQKKSALLVYHYNGSKPKR